MKKQGTIYILTNPSFPDYVKIGYSENVNERVKKLNSSEAVPFSFRLYATYEVEKERADTVFHRLIDKLKPELRSVEVVNDKVRKREFYFMLPEVAYELLEDIAVISGTTDRLHLIKPTKEEIVEEETAEQNRELAKNRHHFKHIEFHSSLTKKTYYSKTKEDGTLGVFEKDTNIEIPNKNKPSKKQILLSALKDLGETATNELTLYQIQHRLEKIILQK